MKHLLRRSRSGYGPDGPAATAAVNHSVLCDLDDSAAGWNLTASCVPGSSPPPVHPCWVSLYHPSPLLLHHVGQNVSSLITNNILTQGREDTILREDRILEGRGQFTLGNGISHNGYEGHVRDMRESRGRGGGGLMLQPPPVSHVNLHSPAS
ncbi:hypothetical protein NQZ68_012909 [Dissostichus eleginoides]|nr:hypothetical protein NQZ68_012909 [Dissostichus eleginoides]